MALTDGTSRLVLVSAWNDSGGGFLHRLLDGHPGAAVWPFELQLGTPLRHDALAGAFHANYRWPVFPDDAADAGALFDLIIDEELKTVLRGASTKFDAFALDVDLKAWRSAFCAGSGESRRQIVSRYIDSFFTIWRRGPVAAQAVIGHCPCIILDADEIFADFPDARFVHVVRDPVAALADFRRRHPGFDVRTYATRWVTVNTAAARACRNRRGAVLLVRFGDLLAQRERTMRAVLAHVGLPFDPVVLVPTWNGRRLDETDMGPFGGVPVIGVEHERDATRSVSHDEADLLHSLTAETQAALTEVSATG